MKTETNSSGIFGTRPKEDFLLLFWWLKAQFRTRKTRQKDIGRLSAQMRTPDSRSRHATGSIGWSQRRGRWSRLERAPPTGEFTRWREIRPVAWAWRITSAGNGSRVPVFPSFAFRVAQYSRTISRKFYFICSTWRPGELR